MRARITDCLGCDRLIGKQITGAENPIADCLISDASFCCHSGQNRHADVDIVVDDHLALGVVETVIWVHPDEER